MNPMQKTQLFVLLAFLAIVFCATGIFESRRAHSFENKASALPDEAPVGTILAWAGEMKSIPDNWKFCNGRSLNKKKYPALFEAIGANWGGDGAPKFNLPDLRGLFLRGIDAGKGRDPDTQKRTPSKPGGKPNGIGSLQDDSFQNHAHNNGPHLHDFNALNNSASISYESGINPRNIPSSIWPRYSTFEAQSEILGPKRYHTRRDIFIGEETRPKNAYVYWIIKVK